MGRCCSVLSGGSTVLALDLIQLGAGGTDLLVQRAPFGIGNRAGGILRLDAIVHQHIQKGFLAHILEEVFLPPTLEHAVGHLDVTQVPATGHDLSLMVALTQAGNLPQAKFAFQETHRLI